MARFLGHLVPWVDEIIVVDDGSTDATGGVVRGAGPQVRLIEQRLDPQSGGFAEQRNRGIFEARSDWLLHMDIDERVTPRLAHEILGAIRSEVLNGYRYRRLNFFLQRRMLGGGLDTWNNVQLARRGHHRFENAVHEMCVVDGAPVTVGQLEGHMWHLSDECYSERVMKSVVYSQDRADGFARGDIRVRWYHLLLGPWFEFCRKFLVQGGCRDGVTGLLWSMHCGCSAFRAFALAWDEQNRVDRSVVEDELEEMWRRRAGST